MFERFVIFDAARAEVMGEFLLRRHDLSALQGGGARAGRGAHAGRSRGREQVGLGFVGEGDGFGFQVLEGLGAGIEQVLTRAIRLGVGVG